jgi:ABC-type Fe3+/spermidine/putrescine transport system ATPase subunit
MAALDPQIRHRMQTELKDLQRRLGIAFVLVTHDQDEALLLADRLAVLNQGRLEQMGAAQDVYAHPESLFVAHFLGQMNDIPCVVRGVDAERIVLSTLATGRSLIAVRPKRGDFVPSSGEKVRVLVRPEHVRISGPSPRTNEIGRELKENHLKARVAAKIFQGPMTKVRMLVDEMPGRELAAFVLGSLPSDGGAIQIGDEAVISFSPDDLMVIREPQGAVDDPSNQLGLEHG